MSAFDDGSALQTLPPCLNRRSRASRCEADVLQAPRRDRSSSHFGREDPRHQTCLSNDQVPVLTSKRSRVYVQILVTSERVRVSSTKCIREYI